MITTAHDESALHILEHTGKVFGYQVGKTEVETLYVNEDHRRKGYGTALLEAVMYRAFREGVAVFEVEVHEPTSLAFWRAQGFSANKNNTDSKRIIVRKVLDFDHETNGTSPEHHVIISFFEEDVMERAKMLVFPLKVYTVSGRFVDDQTLQLSQRVVGLNCWIPPNQDLVLCIQVDGEEIYFHKAKLPKARELGVQVDRDGRGYFIDKLNVREEQFSLRA